MLRRRRSPVSRRAATRRAVRRTAIALVGKAGPYVDALVLLVVGGAAVAILRAGFGIGSAADIAAWMTSLALSASLIYSIQRVRQRQVRLIALTLSYLASGERDVLDTLLASLIGYRLGRDHWDSARVLFGALSRVLEDDDWEMRRRVSEALPALGALDPARSYDLFKSLRDDWHEERYHDDLRRRALEALILDVGSRAEPLVFIFEDRSDLPFEDLIALRDDDSVFTALACVEACAYLERDRTGRGQELCERSLNAARERMGPDDIRALETAWKIWTGPRDQAEVDAIRAAMSDDSMAVQIAAVRAAHRLADRYPIAFIEILEAASSPERHRYVRRAVAREVNTSVVLDYATKGQHSKRASELLDRLLQDDDDIIPLTVFDQVETWTKGRGRLLARLSDLAIARASPGDLVRRAERAKHRLKAQARG